ncbi:MCE family protein [Amycolatopsis acidiphila]|uniref:MCE family protein n=1 Tax=Amycolatopsis acidiphila TaxID=715473 RepID=A0A558AL51_9PSEU|nr:MCE family protein [Amycolatopsis acidiphila]TVT24980.1 MCE family protein [Amycolatopsis acidiphila]UIJ57514.1 MCE family protein [Amycolatopsis acidiphila]GHG96519.1 ABC transporter substrate-binding protein [Amycolatopsis acidiphila]
MKAFEERDPVRIGIAGVVVIALLTVAAYFSDDLPLIGGGTLYRAEFTEAAGLKTDDEVRMAGVKIGQVKAIELDGGHVLVSFRAKNAFLGDQTRASIEIKTLLGQKYIALESAGKRPLEPGQAIPVARTRSPFDVNDALSGLSDTVDQIDTRQLAQSFETIAQEFSGTPEQVRPALDSLSALSTTISSRDEQLHQLLGNTSRLSRTLADSRGQIQRLITDGSLLLDEVQARKAAISSLLQGAQALSVQLAGLVADNQQQLGPALSELDQVTGLLQRNQDNLSASLNQLAPFYRLFANTLGNGRWFDVYVCGLLPPTFDLNLLNINPGGCRPQAGGGR